MLVIGIMCRLYTLANVSGCNGDFSVLALSPSLADIKTGTDVSEISSKVPVSSYNAMASSIIWWTASAMIIACV